MAVKTEEMRARGEALKTTLKETPLHVNNLKLNGSLRSRQMLTVHFSDKGQEAEERGQLFVELPGHLPEMLRDSYVSPDSFLDEFARKGDTEAKRRLLNGDKGNSGNLAFYSDSESLSIKVFHGSTNNNALRLSQLAKEGTVDKPDNRFNYQMNLAEVIEPVVRTPSDAPIRIVEDCLASGDTVVGVIKAIAEQMKMNGDATKVTLDVAVATAQGILLLKKFAEDNGIKLDLNIGYMAFGLSSGQKAVIGFEHANYIVYPEDLIREMEEINPGMAGKLKPEDQVVGDMGDFSVLLPERSAADRAIIIAPWNRHRHDSYGGENKKPFREPKFTADANQHMVYLTNGGYLMRAFYNYFNDPEGKEQYSEVAFGAKRRWTKEYGYGVLLKEIAEEIWN